MATLRVLRKSWLERLWSAPSVFVAHFRNIRPDRKGFGGFWIKLHGAAMLTKILLKWK